MTATRVALAGCAVLALAVVLTPWFALGEYTPNGWDATWWARIALAATLGAVLALRGEHRGTALALIVVALVCIGVRAISPPDFGFAFDGLRVPVTRRWGLWLALVAGLAALAATAWSDRQRRAGSELKNRSTASVAE